jgi:hypothetical protein
LEEIATLVDEDVLDLGIIEKWWLHQSILNVYFWQLIA